MRRSLRHILLLFAACALTAAAPPDVAQQDNAEVQAIVDADQAERSGATIDWNGVAQRDKVRHDRVLRLYSDGALHTAADFYNAALVLQHGRTAEDYLLAHELAVVAAAKGHPRASWLAAAAEDRFLMNIGRAQRFGTQFVGAPGKLWDVDRRALSVTDQLREQMAVPSLAQACARERVMAENALPPAERAAALEQRLRTSPGDVATMMRLAAAYREWGRADDVRETYRRVIAVNPSNADAHYDLACLEATERRPDVALQALADAVAAGFADVALATTDSDLDWIRNTPRFAELLESIRRNAAARTKR